MDLTPANTYAGNALLRGTVHVRGHGATVDLDINDQSFRALFVDAGSSVTLSDLTIRGGDISLLFSANAKASLHSVILRDANQGISHPGDGVVVLDQCTLTRMEFAGASAGYDSGRSGIELWMAGGIVSDCSIGLQVRRGQATIAGTHFASLGTGLSASGMATLRGASFDQCSFAAIQVIAMPAPQRSLLMTSDLSVSGGQFGILAEPSCDLTLETCVLADQDQAISHAGGGTVLLTDTCILRPRYAGLNLGHTRTDGPVEVAMQRCQIADGPRGLQVFQANAQVEGSSFTNLDAALYGTGTFSIRHSAFSGGSFAAIHLDSESAPPLLPRLTLVDSNLSATQLGVRMDSGWFSIEGCVFRQMQQGVSMGGLLASETEPARLVSTRFEEMSSFAIAAIHGGFLDVNSCQFEASHVGLQLNGGVRLRMTGSTLDSLTLPLPGVGISLQTGSRGEIRDTRIRGHLNSVDLKSEAHVLIEDCQMEVPLFSGLIVVDASECEVRRSLFVNCGQDAIFCHVGEAGEYWGSKGLIEDCQAINSGAGEADPSIGRMERRGSGMAFEGGGPWSLRRNLITGSYDLGLHMGRGASAEIRENSILDNRLTGLNLSGAGDVVAELNMISGHAGAQQTGILFSGAASGRVALRRTFLEGNLYGLLANAEASSLSISDGCFLNTASQALSLGAASLFLERTALVEAGDYLVFVGSGPSPILQQCTFSSSARLGVYAQSSAPVLAVQNYWGSSLGPWDAQQGPSPDSRCAYHNAIVQPYAEVPPVEVFFTGDPFRSVEPLTLSASASPWIEVEMPSRSEAWAVMGAIRTLPHLPPAQPPGLVMADPRPMVFWVAPAFRRLPGEVVLSIESSSSEPVQALAAYDSATDTWRVLALGERVGQGDSRVQFRVEPARMATAIYYLVSVGTPFTDFRNGWMLR